MTYNEARSAEEGAVDVLLVDPDREFVELVKAFLRREAPSLSVEIAASAEAALDRLEHRGFDCVVSEHALPDRSGLQLLETIRDERPRLPFVLLTGEGSEALASEALVAGATDYLPKKNDSYETLADRIVQATRHAEGRDEGYLPLREIVEIFPQPVYLIDESGEVLLCNRALADLHGLSREELEGSHVRSYLEEEVADQLLADMASVFEGDETSVTVEREVHDGDGNPRWIEGRLVEYTLPDGTRAVLGTSIDLTHRERRERELEDMRMRLEAAMEAGAIGTWEWDIVADEIVANPSFARTFGVDPGDAAEGVPLDAYLDAIHPEDRDRVVAAIEKAVEECSDYREEYRVRGSDGEIRWVSAKGHVEDDDVGEATVFRGAVTEITDRKERERRLEALNRRNSDLVSADTPDEVLRLGVDAATDVLGLDVNGIFLHDPDEEALMPEVVSERAAGLLDEMPAFPLDGSIAGRAFRSKEALAIPDVREDPDVFNVETESRSELHLPIGEYGVLVAGATEVAAFDREDRVMGELLASNITAALDQVYRTQELEARERELSEQYQRLDEFTSVVSHDLRNPLNVAIGRLELVREENDDEHLAEIARAHDRMKSLIEHLLTMAHRDDLVEATEWIDLRDLAETSWGFVPTAEASLEIATDIHIDGERTRLRQLFENLFRNAVEHAGEDVSVTVGGLEDGFYVADDGPGIPEELSDEIFQAGYSGRGNTGYGLSIVEQVADAHEWEIDIGESDRGGARFEFRDVDTRRPDELATEPEERA